MTDTPGTEQEPVPSPAPPPAEPEAGFSWGVAVFLAAAVAFVIFAVQNMRDVPLKFFGWEFTVPLPLLLVVTALISVVADELVGVVRRRRRRRRLAEREELARFRRS